MKTLIFLTSDFPFGTGEAFVENEFPFLAEKFERVFIITTSLHTETLRPVPDHVKVIHIPYDASVKNKILALSNLLSRDMRVEINFIRERKLTLNRAVVSIMLGCYAKALEMNELLEKIVQQHSLDLKQLYLYSYWMKDLTAGMAMFKQQHPEVKAFCRAHGWDTYFERHHPPYLPFRHFILSRMDACFCISTNGIKYINKITQQRHASKIHLARLGSFNKSRVINPASSGKLRVVSCSSLIPLKRVHLIIYALSLLPDVEVEWTHFGDGKLLNEVKRLAADKLSAMKHLTYRFAGKISNTSLMEYYASQPVDVFINVSETEGLPVSIMEANSFGIPAIATNVGGVSEIILNGSNGLLLDPNPTTAEIAAALKKFSVMTTEEKSIWRKNAFEVWNTDFNADKNYAEFVQRALAL